MIREKPQMRALIVSGSPKVTQYLTELLTEDRFSAVTSVSSAGEAKRMMIDMPFDMVLINTPLTDEFGIQLALDLSEENETASILLFVKTEQCEQVSYKVEDYGILTLARPNNRQNILQAVHLMVATRIKLRALEQKASTMKSKMEEIRLVNRAKLLLMQQGLSEAEAHRHIEKAAMDASVKRREIAKRIIRTYESV